MNTTELIELAKMCEAYTVEDGAVTTVIFGEEELQQFAQRIEQPHLQRIAELENQVKELEENLDIEREEVQSLESDIQGYADSEIELTGKIEQLREAATAMVRYQDLVNSGTTYGLIRAYAEMFESARKALEQTK